tara:strand:+ start:6146 stop:6592 length:447 start_codon:yes stop_codon:yes gene_type:complete
MCIESGDRVLSSPVFYFPFALPGIWKFVLVKPKIWTLSEARSALPEIKRITHEARKQFEQVEQRLRTEILPENLQEQQEARLQEIIASWAMSIMEMGVEVKGPWLVDFDHGTGYYCWHHGEENLSFEHGYEEGFAGRRPIAEDNPEDL